MNKKSESAEQHKKSLKCRVGCKQPSTFGSGRTIVSDRIRFWTCVHRIELTLLKKSLTCEFFR